MSQSNYERLKQFVSELNEFKKEELIEQPRWGEINFRDVEANIDRILAVGRAFKNLPVEFIPAEGNTLKDLNDKLENARNALNTIRQFSLSSGNRNEIGRNVVNHGNDLFRFASSWIPMLAFLKGDYDENLNALNDKVKEAEGIINAAQEETKAIIQVAQNDVEELKQMKEEAQKGLTDKTASEYAILFGDEAQSNAKKSWAWLTITSFFAVTTVAFGFYVAFKWRPDPELTTLQLTSLTIGKSAVFAILITATLWCGRVYKTLQHLKTVYKHKQLSLSTFHIFRDAAGGDEATKNAVLLETTRTIFGTPPTGFMDPNGKKQDTSLNFVDLSKPFNK